MTRYEFKSGGEHYVCLIARYPPYYQTFDELEEKGFKSNGDIFVKDEDDNRIIASPCEASKRASRMFLIAINPSEKTANRSLDSLLRKLDIQELNPDKERLADVFSELKAELSGKPRG